MDQALGASKYPQDTIVAISTPPGRGGIGIVRAAGPEAVTVATALLELRHPLDGPEAHARASFARVLDPAEVTGPDVATRTGGAVKTIDECVVTVFHAPHSYTGDTVVEIAAHGSPVILEALLRGALAHGARLGLAVRLAEPGEFTQRAFLSGRLDLTQAEAVQDLIAAQTLQQARVAAQQLGGALSRRVAPAKERLLHLIALLEAGMDFASGELDDVDVVAPEEIAAAIEGVRAPLTALVATFGRGQLLRNGAAIALVGRPNVGKSSLFNRLLERERAIVTPLAGTTRDTLEEAVALGGIPVRLIDTAGLRVDGADEVERHGMARTQTALADADLVLHVVDVTALDDAESRVDLAGRPHVVVYNKVDLLAGEFEMRGGVGTSAVTGFGLEALRAAILEQLNAAGSLAEAGLLNNLRQQQAVVEAIAALEAGAAANDGGLPHEIVLLDLHRALRAVDSLTGATTTDDILARIFSTFCIGK